jgi:hypothetical protein
MSAADRSGPWRKVRIWLGDLLIAEYVAESERAARYRRVMAPRFSGLRITIEPLPTGPVGDGGEGLETSAARLPHEQLWSLTVQ